MRRFFANAGLLAAVALLAVGPEPQWKSIAATDVRAYHTMHGVAITASVQLQNACWEAKIIQWPAQIYPAQYQVVTRTKPEDIGVMCTMAVKPDVASGWFAIDQQTVTIHADTQTLTVKVQP